MCILKLIIWKVFFCKKEMYMIQIYILNHFFAPFSYWLLVVFSKYYHYPAFCQNFFPQIKLMKMKQSTCSHRQQRNAAALYTEFTKIWGKNAIFTSNRSSNSNRVWIEFKIEFRLSLLVDYCTVFFLFLYHC